MFYYACLCVFVDTLMIRLLFLVSSGASCQCYSISLLFIHFVSVSTVHRLVMLILVIYKALIVNR